MMKVTFTGNPWEDYQFWQRENKKIIRKINRLIRDIRSTPFEGMGKPEPLKYDLAGLWSRRIDLEHRLVYAFRDGELIIFSCRYHYDSID